MNAENKAPVSYLLKLQQEEVNGAAIYRNLAKREKDPENQSILLRIASDESKHANIWKGYTQKELKPNGIKIFIYGILGFLFGYTFVIKRMEKNEELGADALRRLADAYPEVEGIIRDEESHEDELIGLLDEERLQYIGALVLGLNDALVELTGALAGLIFATANTRLVALSGIITGVSATLSMAASNFLAERADGNPNALKSSLFTGAAYLITVALMVLPYLLFPPDQYIAAFVTMLAIVMIIILVFNYYLSVVRSTRFLRNFGEMALISLGVMVVSFLIGTLARNVLGLDI